MSVRVCVCGDEGVGKSSLITCLVKDVFVTNRIQPVLPQITLPPTLGTPENVTTVIVDTSALPHERTNLRKELRKSNVILLVYSDHYSYERVALFWMPFFRAQGVSVPVILCANKSDVTSSNTTPQIVEEEMLPVMAEFKEIDSCIRTSAREHHNVNEVFYLCQKAVTHPIAPLFDSKELSLKPAAVTALKRIFYLCDKDQDGLLNDEEILAFQRKVFDKDLLVDDLTHIKQSVRNSVRDPTTFLDGITESEFLSLCTLFVEKGRHETLWSIVRKFQYTDSLSLKDSFLHPRFDVPQHTSAELSPIGYRFFVDMFLLFDKDNDGGLSTSEIDALFAPTPGIPQSWLDMSFPSCTVVNEHGHITLQGWLAQWSMTTFTAPETTLEYLAYLGFETTQRGGITVALQVTPSRKRRRNFTSSQKVDRNVFLCYVLGKSHSGKSSLLNTFLNRPYDSSYHPTIRPVVAVNSVELQGGKQVYLILNELGEQEPAILDNKAKLDACDLICWTYDSSDTESWDYVVQTREKYAAKGIEDVPSAFLATKADGDRAVQKTDVAPESWCTDHGFQAPLHTSIKWGSVGEVFVHLAESAMYPSNAFPRPNPSDQQSDRMPLYVAIGVTATAVAAAAVLWHRHASASL